MAFVCAYLPLHLTFPWRMIESHFPLAQAYTYTTVNNRDHIICSNKTLTGTEETRYKTPIHALPQIYSTHWTDSASAAFRRVAAYFWLPTAGSSVRAGTINGPTLPRFSALGYSATPPSSCLTPPLLTLISPLLHPQSNQLW